MRRRLIALAEERTLLRQRAAEERDVIDGFLGRGDDAAAIGLRVHGLLEELRRRPLWVAAGAAFLIALRPRRALSWLAKGWSAWRLYRGAARWLAGFAGAQGGR
jgi:hypothetical protein